MVTKDEVVSEFEDILRDVITDKDILWSKVEHLYRVVAKAEDDVRDVYINFAAQPYISSPKKE